MPTRLQRILNISVFLLLIIPSLVGCGDTSAVPATSTPAETTKFSFATETTTAPEATTKFSFPTATTTTPATATPPTTTAAEPANTPVITETPTATPDDSFYKMKIADAAFFAQLDARADAMRAAILSSPSSYEAGGMTYYVSNDGNDANTGRSPETPWATIGRVNDALIAGGARVLFKRGDLWREQIIAKDGVTYSAYGAGDKPEIYGSARNYAVKESWLATGYPDIYVCADTFENDVGIIVFNNGEAWGIRKIKYVDYFLNVSDLKEDLNFYYNSDDKKVYLYSAAGNPGERFADIEIGDRRHGIVLTNAIDVTIDNLCVKYWGAHGLAAGGLMTQNLTVRNCEFGWIGGTFLYDMTRYGNAIEVWCGCENYTVENCYVYQIYDAGVTHQFSGGEASFTAVKMTNVLYRNNLIEYCTYSIEYFLSQDNPDHMMENILIQGNLCRFSGYGWGDQRPDKWTPAHINGWDHNNPAINFVVENNIFDRGKYRLIYMGAADAASLPVMRNNTYIAALGASLGGYGQKPAPIYVYDKYVGKIIEDIFGDEGAEVYYFVNQP